MKRLYLNNCAKRNLYNNLNSKIYKYTHSTFFLDEKKKIFNQCFTSYYTKNILKKFHISSKSFKYLSSYGKLPGIVRFSW